MDDLKLIKRMTEKMDLDVPILKVVRANNHITFYLYGGAVIEIEEDQSSPHSQIETPGMEPHSRQKESHKKKVRHGCD